MKQDSNIYTPRGTSHRSPLWQRTLHAIFRFLFSKRGIVTLVLLLVILPLIWMYMILGGFRPLFWDMAKLGGVFGQKTYLLLIQNENEIRPTGGFLTSFAVVRVTRGNPEISFYNSEQVAIPQPEIDAPEAIQTAFSKDPKYAGWVFRDSNFALDFEQNAQKAIEFLAYDPQFAEEKFDGVIAIDMKFLEDTVDLLGPFELEGENISGDNLFETVEFVAKNFDHHNFAEWESRKNVVLPLAQQMLSTLKSSPGRWKDFFLLAQKNADQKHLLFSFSDTGLQKKMQTNGWTGRLPSSFWGVNFANLGGRKGDRFLRKRYESSLHVEANGTTRERFTISISHEGTYHLQSDEYQAFVRVVRPKGTYLQVRTYTSEHNFSALLDDNEREYGEEFSFFMRLLPGEQKRFTLFFELPTASFSASNPLTIPLLKQPGSLAPEWNFTLRGENDPRFSATGCTTQSARENVFFCDVTLSSDTNLVFTKYPDTTPPLLQFAQFTSADRIEARFSEDIAPDIPLANFTLLRADGSEERIPILNIQTEGESIFLDIGVNPPRGAGERFFLEIKDLRDISNNSFVGEQQGLFLTTLVQQ